MNPILKVNLPKLSAETEQKILAIAAGYDQFKYSNGTLGKKYHEEQDHSSEIEDVKNLYGFDYLPQHRSTPCDQNLQNEIRDQIKLYTPASISVQVIETENSFIHTDGGHRTCSLYYLLTDNTSITNFYKSNEPPLITTIWDPNKVKKYFSYEMKQHEWHTFSHNEIHSVNNIKNLRVGLIIDMTKQFKNYEDFVRHLKTVGVLDV
jgi:hypothetical protein